MSIELSFALLLIGSAAHATDSKGGELVLGVDDLPGTNTGENLLVVIVDDVGIDAVSSYAFGADPAPTPALDSLADSGVTFAHAWANPACSPTRASLLTGLSSSSHGVSGALGTGEVGLDMGLPTVADSLRSQGYTTGLVGKWHLGDVDGDGVALPDKPLYHGFDVFQGTLHGAPWSFYEWERYDSITDTTETEPRYTTWTTTDDAVAFVEGAGDAPWLAVVSYNAGHWSEGAVGHSDGGHHWEAPPTECFGTAYRCGDDGERDCTVRELFLQSVQCVDSEIERLLTELAGLGELVDTTVVFLGDNGTDSEVADDYEHRAKGTVYQGGVHVPFIVADGYHYQTGRVDPRSAGFALSAPGRISTAPVHVQDVFATFEEIAGVPAYQAHADQLPDSWSFAAELDGSGTTARPHLSVSFRGDEAVMDDRYRLVVEREDGVCRLYDITGPTPGPADNDEGERFNLLPFDLLGEYDDILAELEALLQSGECASEPGVLGLL